MKKTALNIATLAFLLVFASCKKEIKETVVSDLNTAMAISENEVVKASDELAPDHSKSEIEAQYLYVTATSGLSLRAYNNLQSDKLARMPYGTKVKVLTKEPNATMTVGGIRGGMNEVEFNHKKGFAFNGYLSKYFPPERDISAKGYASELKTYHPTVVYNEETGGTVSKPIHSEYILLPEAQWHEAFFMAQRLFDFPKEFVFPTPKGKNTEIINDSKPKKGVWISQLEVTRSDNSLEKITYVYGSQKFDATVTIEKVEGVMKISRTEKIK
ncbi:MAG: hypothetical protein AAF489_06830 [Bacteroidota bacterium]